MSGFSGNICRGVLRQSTIYANSNSLQHFSLMHARAASSSSDLKVSSPRSKSSPAQSQNNTYVFPKGVKKNAKRPRNQPQPHKSFGCSPDRALTRR
mmetsp:Transcript_14454/g.17865  ORF Transcript_14454/g.17865 Transcript_14454/m.17865 type:complete len:96 (+) Transcript_14454:275-562(+)